MRIGRKSGIRRKHKLRSLKRHKNAPRWHFGARKGKSTLGAKPKRRKKGEITKLKKKLWEIVRQVVFKKYGTDCYTCHQKNLHGKNLHGGHVPWASSELSITCRYDPRYIRAQCYDCNVHKNGRGVVAFKKMVLEGIDTDELWKLNQETKGVLRNKEWFEAKIVELSTL